MGGGSKKQAAAPAVSVPAPVAPPTAQAVEVTETSRRARLGASLRRGLGRRSIRAGETLSGTNYQSSAGQARLLSGV